MNNKTKTKFFIIILLPITFILNLISKKYPWFIEYYYSTGINKLTREVLSKLTGLIPFSSAEILFFILLLVLAILIINIVFTVLKGGFFNRIINLTTYISILYTLFMFLWGFNYNRLSFDKIANLPVEKSSAKELYELCRVLGQRANELSTGVNRNEKGIMVLKDDYRGVFKRAEKGFQKASILYPELGGKYGTPKRILLSEELSYTGITGIYMPYTGEANINTNVTDFTLPATACHEMAHQRGFAREDEANYIAYVTCSFNSDIDFQYSGVMLALIYSGNALSRVDADSYRELVKSYSEGVRKDLGYDYEFWQKYKGKTEEISNNINNSYLKSNGQKDGVQSYGRMVDLLLAERRKAANKY